jgi:ssDNA thymidine ADP-ribosyltransferase, DarT
MPPPAQPKIYHIVHVDRLTSIIADGCLWCDAEINRRAAPGTVIGMGSIKQRRLTLPVDCHPGCCVADFVPFYFCSRSVMLYVIHRANHEELAYRGGQEPIVHLEADLHAAVAWANGTGRRWTFSLSNAGAQYAHFRASLTDLHEINWQAVGARDWAQPDLKEGKQAEFLVHESFPWSLVSLIGVRSQNVYQRVLQALNATAHRPKVEILRSWYY